MKLYEINEELENLIDVETGEIADVAFFEDLCMTRTAKIEGIALYIKNLDSDAAALKAEETALAKRRKAAENTAARLKEYLTRMLTESEKFETPRVKLSWRKSSAVAILIPEADFVRYAQREHDELLSYSEPTINKKAITDAIKAGQEIIGAALVEHQNLQIK
jgi:outer membrane murein-binding lipoprotein Lpp